jgi:Fuc2NAc and GlcNAc transferase
MLEGILIALSFVFSLASTGWYRQRAIRLDHVDVPGSRSSHQANTPTGGGVVIVTVFALAVFCLVVLSWVPFLLALSLIPVFSIGVLGYLDDHRDIGIMTRVVVELLLVGAFILGVSYLLADQSIYSLATIAILVFAITWWINLFNFMDGIDGIALSQAIYIALSASLLTYLNGYGLNDITLLLLLMTAVCLGFLKWNWQPARIFMGDSGSLFLGFMLGALCVLSVSRGELSLVTWLILAGLFIVDATCTLIWRLARRENIFQAHRSHVYQLLAIRLGQHRKVVFLYSALNLLGLLPCAWFVLAYPDYQWIALLISYVVLAGLWFGVKLACQEKVSPASAHH